MYSFYFYTAVHKKLLSAMVSAESPEDLVYQYRIFYIFFPRKLEKLLLEWSILWSAQRTIILKCQYE